jgi:hypothetical protein
MAGRPVRMATLGPAGTNHELVARRYLDFHGAATSGLRFAGSFREVFAIDCFISDSRPLAILTRADVATPRSIGLVMPATESYADLRRWQEKVPYAAIPLAFADLLAGRIDSALAYRDYADGHPGLLRVDEEIGSPDDVWIVYGRERAHAGGLLASRDSAFARRIGGPLSNRASSRAPTARGGG